MIGSRTEGYTLKASLYLLAIACTLPVCIVAAGLVYFLLNEHYARTQNELSDRASLMAGAVELRIQNVTEDLQILAASPSLRAGDLPSFRLHMVEAARLIGAFGLVLVDRQGQLIASSRRATGESLPRRSNLETQEKVFTSGKVQISGLVESTVGASPFVICTFGLHAFLPAANNALPWEPIFKMCVLCGFRHGCTGETYATQPGLFTAGAVGRKMKGAMPMVMKDRPTFPDKTIEPLNVRRDRHAVESKQAMKDYQHTQQAVRDRMAALRAERLEREAKDTEGA